MLLFLIALSPWLSAGAVTEPVSAARSAGASTEQASGARSSDTLAAQISAAGSAGASAEPVNARRSAEAPPARAPRNAMELRVLALYGDRNDREFPTISSVRAGTAAIHETGPSGRPLHRQTEDPWFGFDKVQHVSFSFLWTLGTQYVVVNKGRLSEPQALPISVSTSAALGLSKEMYDLHWGPQRLFSYRDLVADGVGILLAVGLILL